MPPTVSIDSPSPIPADLGHRPYRPFVVNASPRTGSYMLTTTLDQHPEIRCHGEALSPWREDCPPGASTAAEFLCQDVYTHDPPAKAVGFKLLDQDARQGRFSDARSFLRASRVRVIHLRRRNLLRQALSFAVAEKTDVWILEGGERRPEEAVVELEPSELIRNFESAEGRRLDNERWFAPCPTLDVCYEDMAHHLDAEMERISRFLGVTPRPVRPTTRRQEQRPLQRAIGNYETIARTLSGTSWEVFLDEDDTRYAP